MVPTITTTTTTTAVPPVPTKESQSFLTLSPEEVTSPAAPTPTVKIKGNSWINTYETFLLQNAGRISSIESTIRSFSYLVTGQVQEVEIASETIYSTLQILGLYHDKIIAKASKSLLDTDPLYRPSTHNRYTGHYMRSNKSYRRIVLFLTLIRCTELLWEMIARRKFKERGRWMAIIILEILKASCRLGLLVSTKARPLISPPVPEREIDPNRISCDEDGNLSLIPVSQDPNSMHGSMSQELQQELPLVNEDASANTWKMPRRGMGLPKNPMQNSVDQFLAQKVLAAEDVRAPEYLLHQLSTKGLAAETLHILRPLVYALLAYYYRRNKRNWTPWIAGILLEYGSRKLAFKAYKESLPGGFRSLTKLEDEEQKNRAMSFGWWMLRGAMYENWTRPALESVLHKVSLVPLGGQLFGAIVEDYLYLFDNYYFPSSTL